MINDSYCLEEDVNLIYNEKNSNIYKEVARFTSSKSAKPLGNLKDFNHLYIKQDNKNVNIYIQSNYIFQI